jgi:hypothetical protein
MMVVMTMVMTVVVVVVVARGIEPKRGEKSPTLRPLSVQGLKR